MKNISILLIYLLLSFINPTCEKQESTKNSLSCDDRFSVMRSHVQDYVLPFSVGKKYVLSQTCCNPAGGHRNQLGYNFAIYLGDTIYSMRSGIVKEIREDQPDNGGDITARNHNYIMIQHDDSTVAFYAHLMQNSVLVDIGDRIKQGQKIA